MAHATLSRPRPETYNNDSSSPPHLTTCQHSSEGATASTDAYNSFLSNFSSNQLLKLRPARHCSCRHSLPDRGTIVPIILFARKRQDKFEWEASVSGLCSVRRATKLQHACTLDARIRKHQAVEANRSHGTSMVVALNMSPTLLTKRNGNGVCA